MRRTAVSVLACAALFPVATPAQAPIAVLHNEGMVHGFLVLRTLQGETIAEGEWTQEVHGARVKSRLVFHFKDGSVHEESVLFSQRRSFQMLSAHLLQKGPTFKHPMDVSIEAATGQIHVRTTDDDGKEKVFDERLALPPDVANSMVITLLKNIRPTAPETKVSMVVATPKPRLVKLIISPEGEESLTAGGSTHKVTRYDVKIDIGGVKGAIAPLIGKQPPDTHVWVLAGALPTMLKSEGPLFQDGPIWRIELVSPTLKSDQLAARAGEVKGAGDKK